ncbi:oligoendopeptidase F [Eubacterium pyruvativorans]|uniref:oligoendopeptidase F n=1 Tax=Eubacterium pyruvativorans TaxID=155865 RepID=UPI0023EF6D19|nr:oligoendopeptidase F [Eubacterium pyruvativorans]MCI5747111.1 oligoendopeptidase F [Eubacterium pyruvativorans]MDD7684576.1 oligoendopeptidase F [Eubacterium pyruvativorans]
MAEKVKQRSENDPKYQWNIEAMYSSDADWEKDLKDALSGAEDFTKYRDHLADSAKTLADALIDSDAVSLKMERVFVYARMKLDEDNRVSKQQDMLNRAVSAASKISAMMSFLTPELIQIPEETLQEFMKTDARLEQYDYVLRQAVREKAHVLSKAEENILAQLGEVLGAPDQIFTMLNDADLKFGTIRDEQGEETELTHGNYIKFMRSKKKEVREAAYRHCYDTYRSMINTIAANYAANVKTDVITARMRHYPSSRAAALSGGNIPEAVYDNLIATVNETLPVLHRYIALRKDLMGLDELKMSDVYVPLAEIEDPKVSFEEGVALCEKALAPLGEDYLRHFREGIDARWIDVYENEGKTSGAYSFGSYDSMPYVLMNYDGTLQDVFTIIHEMGHSMNSWYTRKAQPFTYGSHSIFTAEVASTVNETLLMRFLLEQEKDPGMRRYILNMYIEAFRSTLFRQTMFAEFELLSHRQVEDGGSLTAEWLSDQYDRLNTKYFGPALTGDDRIRYEWARIPHFYRSFYVYQYATGYSAANAIADKILTEGPAARDAYLTFLASGDSDDPVELLKIAGVDMTEREPVERAMKTFTELVEEFRRLSGK